MGQLFVGLLLAVALVTGWYYSDSFSPNMVARVLYSEAAGANHRERILVAGVMQNRIGHPAFSRAPTLEAVVRQRGAFSCVNDPNNANWQKTRHPALLTRGEQAVWQDCLAILATEIPRALGPSGRPLVFYHDKSIKSPPRGWTNSDWRVVYELTTEHFVFYSVEPAR